jgi:hypothetical protein
VDPVIAGMLYSSFFSLSSLCLALACASNEEGGGVVKNVKFVLPMNKNQLKQICTNNIIILVSFY